MLQCGISEVANATPSERSQSIGGAFAPGRAASQLPSEQHVPLKIGDLIVLHNQPESSRSSGNDGCGDEESQSGPVFGFVHGHACLRRVSLQDASGADDPPLEQTPKSQPQDPSNAQECVFRICPQLHYKATEEVATLRNRRRRSSSSTTSAETLEDQLELEKTRAAAEARENEATMRRVSSGFGGGDNDAFAVALYGSVFQFEHVQTGLFLSAADANAPLDVECHASSLTTGGSSSYWRIKPKYKSRRIGGIVYDGDDWIVESLSVKANYLHVSTREQIGPLQKPRELLCKQPTVDLLPYHWYEVNVSTVPTTFKVNRFQQPAVDLDFEPLTVLEKFVLFHPQAGAYCRASSNALKEAHRPFLKQAINGDALNPLNESCKHVWRFEMTDSTLHGGAIMYDVGVRIRHVSSGKYLSIVAPPEKEPPETRIGDEIWYDVKLVDGEEPGLGLEDVTFFLQRNEHVRREVLPKPSSTVSITVRITAKRMNGALLWLHDSDEPKKKGSLTQRLVFSTVPHTSDVFIIMPPQLLTSQNLDKVLSCRALARRYARTLANSNEPLPTLKSIQNELMMLLDAIALCGTHRGRARENDESLESKIQQALSTLPSAFAKLPSFNFELDMNSQRLARESKLMDAIFEMCAAPYLRSFPSRPFTDAVRGGRREMQPVRAISKFAFVALQKIFSNDEDAQCLFASTKNWTKATLDDGTGWELQDNVRILMSMTSDPLGAAVTLSELVSANTTLLNQFVDDKLLSDFAMMIEQLGPQPRLLDLCVTS